MEDEKISVIVPVYKVEPYLERCVDSILRQTYTNLECILVDDGSPDRCPQICDDYAAKDGRIKAIHQPNAGVSAARNAALRVAKGEYITFVDSDDYIFPDYLMHLMSCMDADYIASGYCFEENAVIQVGNKFECFHARFDDIRKSPELLRNIPMGMVTARKYKRRIIEDNALSFNETLSRSEDVLFNSQYFLCCTSVSILSDVDYCIQQWEQSACERFCPDLFTWSMKSVMNIGKLIGTENGTFYQRVWNNAMFVSDNYFNTAKNGGTRTQILLIRSLFQICRNPYVRNSLQYARDAHEKKKAKMIRCYLYPFLPFIYPIYKKLK